MLSPRRPARPRHGPAGLPRCDDGAAAEHASAIGGIEALVDHLADDDALGRLVWLPASLSDSRRPSRSPRCRRNVRRAVPPRLRCPHHPPLAPGQFAASCLQYPISGPSRADPCPSLGLGPCPARLAGPLRRRARDRPRHRPAHVKPAAARQGWLLPLRKLMSVAVIIASYAGLRVDWRGHTMIANGRLVRRGRA